MFSVLPEYSQTFVYEKDPHYIIFINQHNGIYDCYLRHEDYGDFYHMFGVHITYVTDVLDILRRNIDQYIDIYNDYYEVY